MTFMAGIEARRALAVVRQAVHGADEVNLGDDTGCAQLVPDQGTPACDFRDGVAEGHCRSVSLFLPYIIIPWILEGGG